jgi:vitamin B12 transporter
MFNKLPNMILPLAIITLSSTAYANQNGDIIVTASKTEQSLKTVGSSVTVLTREILEKRGDRTVADSLTRVSGVNLSRRGGVGGQSSIRMRGTNPGQTLVLIDGIRVSDTANDSNSFDFATLMVNDIERIEVLKGNQSSLYGSDAIGGVINIITHKRTTGVGGNGFLEGGSFGTVHGGASVNGGTDKVSYGLSANHFHNDGFSRKSSNKELDGNQISNIRGNVGVDITENLNFNVQGGYEFANFEYDSSLLQANGDKKLFYGKTQLTHLSFDDKLKNTLYFDASQTDRHDNDANLSDFRGSHQKLGYQGDINLFTRDTLTVGTDLTFEDAKNKSFYGNLNSNNENYAYFVNYIKGIGDNLTLDLGGRIDDHDKFGTQATYRTTLAYNIEPTDSKLHASLGTGFKAPTLYQLYDTSYGNKNLQPESSIGFDVGVTQKFLKEYVTTDVTYFHNKIDNLINGVAPNYNYFNIAKVDIKGIEAEINIRATEKLNLFGNYTFTDAYDTTTRLSLERRPKHLFNLGTDFQIDKFQTTLLGKYVGNQLNSGTKYNKSFFTADIKTSYDVTDTVSLYGRVDNIFDTDYQEVLTYNTSGVAAYGGIRLKY